LNPSWRLRKIAEIIFKTFDNALKIKTYLKTKMGVKLGKRFVFKITKEKTDKTFKASKYKFKQCHEKVLNSVGLF